MMVKPMKTLELHYPMIQFLIIEFILSLFLTIIPRARVGYEMVNSQRGP